MATGRRPKKDPLKARAPHATFLQVKNGAKEAGYKAGPVFGVNGHRTHAHQPCKFDLSDGKLQCPYCEAGLETQWRGYLPIWDRDWMLRYVLIGEELLASVDAIPHRAQVVVSRAKNPISPLIVRHELSLTRELPSASPWKDEVDIAAVCCMLWRSPDLIPFCVGFHTAKELPKGIAVKDDGKPFAPMQQAAAKRVGAKVESAEEDINGPMRSILNRISKPTTNGKH